MHVALYDNKPQHGNKPVPDWLGGGTEREVKGEDCHGVGGGVGGGSVKGQLSLESCGHLSGQAENGEGTCSADWRPIATG